MLGQVCILIIWWAATLIFDVSSQKISPQLQTRIEKGGTANIFISFGSTAPTLSAAKLQRSGGTPAEKAKIVRDSLLNLANADQATVIKMLQTQRSSLSPQVTFETMWISNRIYITNANFELVQHISKSPNVTLITEEGTSEINDIVSEPINTKSGPDNGPEDYTYGLKIIQAPEAWKVLGGADKAGEGVLVGVADTGSNVEHEALKENFIGGEYGYYTPYKSEGAENSLLHGTHVTGTAVGRKGVGVAPAAKHVQCQMCMRSLCREHGFDKCIQFFICPTKADGSDPDCSKRVHVINMSLQGLPHSITSSLEAARAAGIILVSAAGNFGPICFTIGLPGYYPGAITTGASDDTDKLAELSSRGPISRNPEHGIKPNVVAPGVNVLSANHETSQFKYIMMSGTSMAAPHLTGLVALLLTRDKTLTHDQVKELIIQNTDQKVNLLDGDWCDPTSLPLGTIPNSMFGYGRINALKAINAQTAMLAGKK